MSLLNWGGVEVEEQDGGADEIKQGSLEELDN